MAFKQKSKRPSIFVGLLAGLSLLLLISCKFFDLNISAILILSGFLLFHPFFAYATVGAPFCRALRGEMPPKQKQKLLLRAFILAGVGTIAVQGFFMGLLHLFSLHFTDGLLLVSPIVFTTLFFFAMKMGIPAHIRAGVMRCFRMSSGSSVLPVSDGYNGSESMNPMNPVGLTNPSSPNYLFSRRHEWSEHK